MYWGYKGVCLWHLLTWSLTHMITYLTHMITHLTHMITQKLGIFIVGIDTVTRTYNKFVCFKPSSKMASHWPQHQTWYAYRYFWGWRPYKPKQWKFLSAQLRNLQSLAIRKFSFFQSYKNKRLLWESSSLTLQFLSQYEKFFEEH